MLPRRSNPPPMSSPFAQGLCASDQHGTGNMILVRSRMPPNGIASGADSTDQRSSPPACDSPRYSGDTSYRTFVTPIAGDLSRDRCQGQELQSPMVGEPLSYLDAPEAEAGWSCRTRLIPFAHRLPPQTFQRRDPQHGTRTSRRLPCLSQSGIPHHVHRSDLGAANCIQDNYGSAGEMSEGAEFVAELPQQFQAMTPFPYSVPPIDTLNLKCIRHNAFGISGGA